MNLFKIIKKLFYFLLPSLFLIASCTPAKKITRDIKEVQLPLGYNYDSPKVCEQKDYKIYLNFNDVAIIDSTSNVKKEKHLFLPLLFFNINDYDIKIELGQENLKSDFNTYFKKTLLTEIKRNACFELVNDSLNCDYILDFEIESVNSSLTYSGSFIFMFFLFYYYYSQNTWVTPAESNIAVKMTLRENEKLLFFKRHEKYYANTVTHTNPKNKNLVGNDIAFDLSNAISLCSKEVISDIIDLLNKQINQ